MPRKRSSPTSIVVAPPAGGPPQLSSRALARLQPSLESAKAYAARSMSESTRRVYGTYWRSFTAWSAEHEIPVEPLPAAPVVALYLSECATKGLAIQTMSVALAAICQRYQEAGLASPRGDERVRQTWRGICRTHGRPPVEASPLLPEHIRAICDACKGFGVIGARDKALVLVGWSAAMRRAEIAALRVQDVKVTKQGMMITIPRSKTDQTGKGAEVAVPREKDASHCPVAAYEDWLRVGGVKSGPIFRAMPRGGVIQTGAMNGQDISRRLKVLCDAAGVDLEHVSGHSLRAGLATSAAAAGKDIRSIQQQTRHASVNMLMRYIRRSAAFDEKNAAAGLLGALAAP